MDGNQGLEALASLCGGALKARTQSENSQTIPSTPNEEFTKMPPPTGHLMHPNVISVQNPAMTNKSQISQQQLYQAVFSAASNNSGLNPLLELKQNFQQRNNPSLDSSATGPAQQLAYYNHFYNAQAAASKAIHLSAANQHQQNTTQNAIEQNIAAALAIATGSVASYPQLRLQGGTNAALSAVGENVNTEKLNGFQSLQTGASQQQKSNNTAHAARPILLSNQNARDPVLNFNYLNQKKETLSVYSVENGSPPEEKKLVKRAANRRSAQLSRKRKKQFIEELKEENDYLRHKEQILKCIPDLIIVFDSGGRIVFVSQSVNRFLDFTSESLEGTSFWNRLCDVSCRLLKAAFMDALAAKQSSMDTTPLGDGLWELRLVDKDGKLKTVVLNGVVHFSGDVPECVCSMRSTTSTSLQYMKSSSSHFMTTRDHIHPQQSINNRAGADRGEAGTRKIAGSSKSKVASKPNFVSDQESVLSGNASDT